MAKKLTLKLNKDIIEKAKQYALEREMSLSQIVEIYFQSLTKENKIDDFKISPFVKSISTGKSISTDVNNKKEYFDYLMEKYN